MDPRELRRVAEQVKAAEAREAAEARSRAEHQKAQQHREEMWGKARAAGDSLQKTVEDASRRGQIGVVILSDVGQRSFLYEDRYRHSHLFGRGNVWQGWCNAKCHYEVTKMPDYMKYVYDAILSDNLRVRWNISGPDVSIVAEW